MMDETVSGFEWDEGNTDHCQKHGLSRALIESVFANEPAVFPDPFPDERRYRAIGKTDEGRFAYVVFMFRRATGKTYIRPISARYMHRKEIAKYEKG